MPTHIYQRFVFIAVASFSVASTLAQQSKPTPRADWLPTVAAADAFLTAQGRWEINGKKPTPIPNPNFHFPDSGTQVGKTRLKVGDTFNVAGSLVDGTPYTLEKTKDARATMVLFLPSHCGACHALLQLEKAWYVKYRDRGLRTVCVNAWDAKKEANETTERHRIPWDVIVPGRDDPIGQDIPFDALPLILLLNEELQIVNATSTGKHALHTVSFGEDAVYIENTLQSLDKLLPQEPIKK